MSDTLNPTRDDFSALLDEQLSGRDFGEGQVVHGRVVGIEKDIVIIDVGLKTEGRVQLKEFGVDENGKRYRIPDPRAEFCQALVADDDKVRERVLGVEAIFGNAIAQSTAFVEAFELCYDSLRKLGVTRTLQTLLGD